MGRFHEGILGEEPEVVIDSPKMHEGARRRFVRAIGLDAPGADGIVDPEIWTTV